MLSEIYYHHRPSPSSPNHHLQNLHHLPPLPQRNRIGPTIPIPQTALRQRRQLFASDPHLLQRPRQAQLPNDGIQHGAQVGRFAVEAPPGEDGGDGGFAPQDAQDGVLLGRVDGPVEAHDGGQEDAARVAVADAERAELVPDAVARAHGDAQEAAADGVPGAEQAAHAGCQVPRRRLRGQQARDQLPQALRGGGVAFGRGGGAADGLDAVVDGSDARAEPDGQGGRGAQFWTQDHEAGPDGEVLEGVFVLRCVVGGAGQGGVFARGEGGGDADDWDGSREERMA